MIIIGDTLSKTTLLKKKYKNRYGVKRIQRNIAYTVAKKKESGIKIKDTAAYLNQAIKDDLGAAFLLAQQAQAKEREEINALCAAREKAIELAHWKRVSELLDKPFDQLLREIGLDDKKE